MDKHNKQLQMINQTMEDANEIRKFQVSVTGIKKILFIWVILYGLYNILISTLQKLNLQYEWYLTEWYYRSYNIFIVLFNLLMGFVLIVGIRKIDMSLKERRFLKTWVFFPLILIVSNIVLTITPYVNTTIMLQFYDAFPFSLIIHSLSLIFIYFYCRQTQILVICICLVIYSILLFIFIATNSLISTYIDWYISLYLIVETISSYKMLEILTTLLVATILKEGKR